MRVRDNRQVLGTKFEKENRAINLGHGSKKAMVKIIANLEPIPKDGDRERAWRDILVLGIGKGQSNKSENQYRDENEWRES